MNRSPRPRALIAGLGNIFLGDDGFGVEVARRLLERRLPECATVADFGIRGVHLAYELLAGEYDKLILVDALPHGAAPGTVSIMTPDLDGDLVAGTVDAHDLHPAAVLQLLQRLGGPIPRVLIVGCEPARTDEGMGLSPAVAAAVDHAVAAVCDLLGAASGTERAGSRASEASVAGGRDPRH
jgi:hydrogenase maturation protease